MNIIQRLRNPPLGTETSERNLMAQAAAEIERLKALLSEARDFIRDEVEENYPWRHKYPRHQIRYELDMDIVHRIDAAIAPDPAD